MLSRSFDTRPDRLPPLDSSRETPQPTAERTSIEGGLTHSEMGNSSGVLALLCVWLPDPLVRLRSAARRCSSATVVPRLERLSGSTQRSEAKETRAHGTTTGSRGAHTATPAQPASSARETVSRAISDYSALRALESSCTEPHTEIAVPMYAACCIWPICHCGNR